MDTKMARKIKSTEKLSRSEFKKLVSEIKANAYDPVFVEEIHLVIDRINQSSPAVQSFYKLIIKNELK